VNTSVTRQTPRVMITLPLHSWFTVNEFNFYCYYIYYVRYLFCHSTATETLASESLVAGSLFDDVNKIFIDLEVYKKHN
jgi:hypothetical protein